MTTASQMRALADHVEALERVRNHAALLAEAIITREPCDLRELREMATDLAARVARADAARWAAEERSAAA